MEAALTTKNVSITVSPPKTVLSSSKVIHIATPSRNDMFTGDYVGSLYKLMARSRTSGLSYSLTRLSCADIEYARNWLISDFYYNYPHCGYILFIDDDMGFEPDLIENMANLKEDVVGAIYHKRSLDIRK